MAMDFQKLKLFEARLDAIISREKRSIIGERIGSFLASNMKTRAGRHKIKHSGRLINSIAYEVKQEKDKITINAGVYGVPYARFHEYGTQNEKGTPPFRILWAILRSYQTLGRSVASKGVFDKQTGRIRARPFVEPALDKNKETILQMIRQEVENARS